MKMLRSVQGGHPVIVFTIVSFILLILAPPGNAQQSDQRQSDQQRSDQYLLSGEGEISTFPTEIGGFLATSKAERKPTTNIGLHILSQHVYRGYAVSNTGAIAIPSVTVHYSGVDLNLHGYIDMTGDDPWASNPDETNLNEADVTLSYQRQLMENLTGHLGYIYYGLSERDDSQEFHFGLSYDMSWITPRFTAYVKYDNYPSWWFRFDFEHTMNLGDGMTLKPALTFFYLDSSDSSFYRDPDNPTEGYGGWFTSQVSAVMNIPLNQYIVFSPKVAFAFPLSGKAKDLVKLISPDNDGVHFYGGGEFSISF